MMKYFVILFFVLAFNSSHAQQFSLEFLDDSVLYGIADGTEPIIFHFEATNSTDSAFLVDMVRLNMDIPEGWEVSLCTEACFPPDVDNAVFFLDEMATDELSVYFYPSVIGMGSTTIRFENTQDPSNYFEQTIYANATPTGLAHTHDDVMFTAQYRAETGEIIVENLEFGRSLLSIYDLTGGLVTRRVISERLNTIDTSSWAKGLYLIKSEYSTFASKIMVH